MTKYAVSGPEIKKILAKAKMKPVAFAFWGGKAPTEDYLGMDIRKAPAVLMKEGKAEKGGKVASGMAFLAGRELQLRCDTFVPNLAKKMKKHLNFNKVTANVVVMDSNGMVLEADVEELEGEGELTDEESPTPPTGEPQETPAAAEEKEREAEPPVDANKKAWLVNRLKFVIPEAKKFAAINKAGGPRVIDAVKATQAVLAKNDLEKAKKNLVSLEKLLRVTPPPKAPPMPAQDETPTAPANLNAVHNKLKAAFAQLEPNLTSFLKRGAPSLTTKATQLEAAFNVEIDGTDQKKAATLFSALKKFVEANLGNLPPLSEAQKAQEAVAAATGPAPASRYEQAAAVMTKYPKGAAAARDAMDTFAGVLGDQPATSALIKQAKKDVADAKTATEVAQARLDQANALPDSDAKTKAIAAAQGDLTAAQGKLTDTKAFEQAAIGKKALTEALAFGPLSTNSGQKFSDDAAAALIAGFTRDVSLTNAALDAASTGQYPDAVALNLSAVIDRKETNFSGNGSQFSNPDFSDYYAKQLLKMGGNTGPEFFTRMPDYLDSGRQFETDPLGDNGIANSSARAQVRSVAVGGALLGAGGRIDTSSQKAKDAIGDLLFNPRSLSNPTPAMNAHVLETLKTFDDPVTGAKASDILVAVPDVTPNASKTLVRKALRKGNADAVAKGDVQKAIMASMLKPLDQGPVGSCFSTAPSRRMRATDPLSAMEAYASIAGTGKYKPANGPEVPVVTRIPANEDPIMRSWEYSLATSTARTAKSSEAKSHKRMTDHAIGQVGDFATGIIRDAAKAEGGLKGFGKAQLAKMQRKGRTKELKREIAEGVEMVYDPTSTIVAASDGKSSTGRYVLKRKDTGALITTAIEYSDYVAEKTIRVFGVEAASAEGLAMRQLMHTPEFAAAVTDGDKAPWAMSSGGQTTAATQTLFGGKLKQEKMTSEGAATDNTADRTKQILSDMIGSLGGQNDEMITVRTVGMHGFNAMPTDPSLDKLKVGGKANLAENIQRELVDPGIAMRDNAYDVDKSVYLYDKIAAETSFWISDRAVRREFIKTMHANRPTTGMTPAQIQTHIEAGITAARPHFADPDGEEARLKSNSMSETQNLIIRDAGAPEFMVADSNWGSSTDHTFFVIVPDPITGDPTMWEKTVPPGTLSKSTRDWTDAEWAAIK